MKALVAAIFVILMVIVVKPLSRMNPPTGGLFMAVAFILVLILLDRAEEHFHKKKGKKEKRPRKTISTIYRNYEPVLRWSIQDKDKDTDYDPDTAVLFDSVVAVDVSFKQSVHLRDGCAVVAECAAAKGSNDPIKLGWEHRTMRLFFEGSFFDKQGRRVVGCRKLTMLSDGKMYASGVRY